MTIQAKLDKPQQTDRAHVELRLAEAGRTLLSLPNTGPSTRLVQSGLEWVRDAADQRAAGAARLRPAIPDAAAISRMDDALRWILLIPVENYVLRRIVGARSLVDPMNGRHLFSWRRIALAIGADHKAIQRWHAQGLDVIVDALRRGATPSGAGLPAPVKAPRQRPVASAAIRAGTTPRPPRPGHAEAARS